MIANDKCLELIQTIGAYDHWSIQRRGNGVEVMVDNENCFVCLDLQSGLEKLKELLEAKNLCAKAATRSLYEPVRDARP
jgi:hypothetical protein